VSTRYSPEPAISFGQWVTIGVAIVSALLSAAGAAWTVSLSVSNSLAVYGEKMQNIEKSIAEQRRDEREWRQKIGDTMTNTAADVGFLKGRLLNQRGELIAPPGVSVN